MNLHDVQIAWNFELLSAPQEIVVDGCAIALEMFHDLVHIVPVRA